MNKKKLSLIIFAIVVFLVCFGLSSKTFAATYNATGSLVSTNLLSGQNVASIDSFFTSSTIATGTSLWVQFATSSTSGPWYNASGTLNATTSIANGTSTIDLSGLGWSGPNFYYKIQFNSNPTQDATPILEEIRVNYTSNSSPNTPTSLTQYKSDCSTVISAGAWTDETEICIKASISDPDTNDRVKLQIEIVTSTDSFANTPNNIATSYCTSTCTSTVSITGLVDGTQYKWQARSIDDDSATSTFSQFNSGSIAFGVDISAPTSVSIISITADSPSQLTITATATDSYSGLHSTPFWFEETSGGSGANDSTDWQSSTDFVDTGLSPNTQYSYRVKAKDSLGNISSYSATSSKYTLANPPTNLSLSSDSTDQITATWSANSNPSGTEYFCENITKGTNSGWITTTSWTSTGLLNSTEYIFRVKARNGDNVSTNWSSQERVSTLGFGAVIPPTFYTPPTPPAEGFKVLISGGAKETIQREVILTLNGGADAVRMSISENPDFSDAVQEPYVATKKFLLSKGDGLKTVYVKFYNQWGQSSQIVSDSIILKTKTLLPEMPVIEKPITEMTKEEFQSKLEEIQIVILDIQDKLQELLTEEPIISEIPSGYRFTKNLRYNQFGDNVRYLQIFLKTQGTDIYPEGIVSGWFGPLTKKAVVRFQEKYAQDILNPWGISKGTGFVGKTTRAKINEILNW